jgi:hypothetical protein
VLPRQRMFPSGISVESRPRGFHPKPLAEPCGTFACHTAPIVRTATFTGVSISLAEVKIAPGIRWGTGNWGRTGRLPTIKLPKKGITVSRKRLLAKRDYAMPIVPLPQPKQRTRQAFPIWTPPWLLKNFIRALDGIAKQHYSERRKSPVGAFVPESPARRSTRSSWCASP